MELAHLPLFLSPTTVELEVTQTEPAVKGATASASYKPAKLETGITIQVPPFIQVGDRVRVNPSEGKYLERLSSLLSFPCFFNTRIPTGCLSNSVDDIPWEMKHILIYSGSAKNKAKFSHG